MKERLVEDWLTRINERGYQTAFGQALLSQGFRVLRIGHSPYEHGKDVLAISPNGDVHCYQLKDGDIALAEWDREYGKTCALVETRPVHPALPADFVYCTFLVTNGGFTDPVLDRIAKHNITWQARGYSRLVTINGRELHRRFVELSSDFWPVQPPDVRAFRSLYLVDGRGDFVPGEFAKFMRVLLAGEVSLLELERRAAAANVFASYLLGEFYRQGDHWNVFRGWILCAAHIAWAGERRGFQKGGWLDSIGLAKEAAIEAIKALAAECQTETAFLPKQTELDEYTCLRNTVAIGAWAVSCLISTRTVSSASSRQAWLGIIEEFEEDGRLWFWGEGALPTLLAIVWLLESEGKRAMADNLLVGFAREIGINQQNDSTCPLPGPYVDADEALKAGVERMSKLGNSEERRRTSVQSYALLPLVLIMVRRGLRKELEECWSELSRVQISCFAPQHSWGYLEWCCDEGTEHDQHFAQPQSWHQLLQLAETPAVNRLPAILRSDGEFGLMFLLAVPHRLAWSIIGTVDQRLRVAANEEPRNT